MSEQLSMFKDAEERPSVFPRLVPTVLPQTGKAHKGRHPAAGA